MLYAILCYANEEAVFSWSKEEDDAVMARLATVEQKLAKEGRLGPVARLGPTKTATSVRKGREPHVTDGPFAETKEAILGFYIVDCDSQAHAEGIAKELALANPGTGGYELRPVNLFRAGPGLQ
jgi:hypothetical protein